MIGGTPGPELVTPAPEAKLPRVAAVFMAYNCASFVWELLDSLVGHVDVIVASIDEKCSDATELVIDSWIAVKKEGDPEVILGTHNVKMPPLAEERPAKEELETQEQYEHRLNVMPGDVGFAAARNKSFSYIPEDIEWVMWIDADDVFGSDVPLREYLDTLPLDATRVWLPYLYHRNDYGDVDTVFYRERIVRMSSKPNWKGRVHEWLESLGSSRDMVEGDIRDVGKAKVWIEHKNAEKKQPGSGERNLRLLEMALAEDPNDARAVLYLGHQLYGMGRNREAAVRYEQYAGHLSMGAIEDERYQALIWGARAWRSAGSISDSTRLAERALMMLPQYQDAYTELSHNFALQKDWRSCVEFHESGIRKQRLNTILLHNPLDYDFNPYSIAHTAYYHLNLFQKAIDCVTKCLEYRPGDREFGVRGMYYLAAYNRAKAIEAVKLAARHLLNTNEPLKAVEILRRAPAGAFEDDRGFSSLMAEAESRTALLHRSPDEYEQRYTEEYEVVKCTKEELDRAPQIYPRMLWIVEQLKKYRAKRVLDVGIGNAITDFLLLKHYPGVEVVGIEVDGQRVKEANQYSVDFGYRKLRPAPEHTAIPPRHAHDAGCFHVVGCYAPDLEAPLNPDGAVPSKLVCEHSETRCPFTEHDHDVWTEGCPKCGPVLMIPDMEMGAPVRFEWIAADGQVPERIRALGPFDAVILAEIAEHVEFPDQLFSLYENINQRYVMTQPGEDIFDQLTKEKIGEKPPVYELQDKGEPKPLIVVTTPDGAWRGPQEINELHMRMWSRAELEAQLAPRGWMLESTILPPPGMGQGNLGAVYDPKLNFKDKPPVTVWCGPQSFIWSPESPNREGVGGSETAVIEVTRDISLHGYRCLVYTEEEGIWSGVRYRKWDKWQPSNPSWLYISWRHPEVFDNPIQANFKYLWIHDVDCGAELNETRAKKIDAILCLSKWHRAHLLERYPFLADPIRCFGHKDQPHEPRCFPRVEIVGNGIDPGRFQWEEKADHHRDANKFIYSSSPDRGLEQLLGYWPKVREKLPEAELHIFYGWDYYDLFNPHGAFKAKIQEQVAALSGAGVKWRGKVNQRELAQEMMSATGWLYPGPHDFCETFCIGAVEAQAAGAVPVTRSNGALPETNIGGLMPEGSEQPAGAALPNAEDWVAAIVDASRWTRGQRKRMAAAAKKMTWSAVTMRIMRLAFEMTKEATRREEDAERAAAAALGPAPVP